MLDSIGWVEAAGGVWKGMQCMIKIEKSGGMVR